MANLGETPGDRIKKLRKEHGYSLSEAGRKIGMSKSYLSQLENGDRNISSNALKMICEFYDISPDYVLYAGNKNKPDYIYRKDAQYLDLRLPIAQMPKEFQQLIEEIIESSPFCAKMMEYDYQQGELKKKDIEHILNQIKHIKSIRKEENKK